MVVLRETGRLTLRLTIAMSALAILAVVVRLIARNKVKLTFKPDDAFILLGLVFFLGVEACLLAGTLTTVVDRWTGMKS
jgi:thiamine transporter ThiT